MTMLGCQPLISFLLISSVVPSRSATHYGLLEVLQGRKHRQPYGNAAVAVPSLEGGAASSTTTRNLSREVDAELEKRRLRRNQSIMLQINLFNGGPQGHWEKRKVQRPHEAEAGGARYGPASATDGQSSEVEVTTEGNVLPDEEQSTEVQNSPALVWTVKSNSASPEAAHSSEPTASTTQPQEPSSTLFKSSNSLRDTGYIFKENFDQHKKNVLSKQPYSTAAMLRSPLRQDRRTWRPPYSEGRVLLTTSRAEVTSFQADSSQTRKPLDETGCLKAILNLLSPDDVRARLSNASGCPCSTKTSSKESILRKFTAEKLRSRLKANGRARGCPGGRCTPPTRRRGDEKVRARKMTSRMPSRFDGRTTEVTASDYEEFVTEASYDYPVASRQLKDLASRFRNDVYGQEYADGDTDQGLGQGRGSAWKRFSRRTLLVLGGDNDVNRERKGR